MKSKFKLFKIVINSFIIVYIGLYLLNISGFYDRKKQESILMTQKQIEKFEKDVEEGKNIDIKGYIKKPSRNYSNTMSNIGYNTSIMVDNFLSYGVKNILKIFKLLFS
jgi:hypothetical protein